MCLLHPDIRTESTGTSHRCGCRNFRSFGHLDRQAGKRLRGRFPENSSSRHGGERPPRLSYRMRKAMKFMSRLWKEEVGAIVSAEIMLVATILVIGVIVGLKSVRDSV